MKRAFAVLVCIAAPVFSELAGIDERSFVSTHVLEIDVPPARVFEALTDEIDVARVQLLRLARYVETGSDAKSAE